MQLHHRTSLVLLAVTACHVGPSLDKFEPAHQPDGVRVRLNLGHRRSVTGELLALQDTALVVRDSGITLVPLRLVNSGSAPGRGTAVDWVGGQLTGRTRERLRLMSRFPQGVTPGQLAALLAAYGVDSLKVLR